MLFADHFCTFINSDFGKEKFLINGGGSRISCKRQAKSISRVQTPDTVVFQKISCKNEKQKLYSWREREVAGGSCVMMNPELQKLWNFEMKITTIS